VTPELIPVFISSIGIIPDDPHSRVKHLKLPKRFCMHKVTYRPNRHNFNSTYLNFTQNQLNTFHTHW